MQHRNRVIGRFQQREDGDKIDTWRSWQVEKTWDNIMSLLVSCNPQAFLDLVIPGCRFIQHHRNKLPSSGRQPDAIIEAWGPIDDRFIFNGEFQTYKEDRLAERLLMYNVLLSQQHYPLHVRSEGIYLIRNDQIDQPPLCWSMPGVRDKEMLRFHYGNTEMWKKSPDDLLRLEHVELLPMLPLTQGGMERDVVEMMFVRLTGERHRQLAIIGFLFAALAFRRARRYSDQEWLERRYNHMHDILRESPAYQWILDEGKEEGRAQGLQEGLQQGLKQGLQQGLEQGLEQGLQRGMQQGLQQGLQQGSQKTAQQAAISIVIARFPELEMLAKAKILALDNLERLQHLIIDLSISHSQEETERVLRSL